jgi:hypothetical protein
MQILLMVIDQVSVFDRDSTCGSNLVFGLQKNVFSQTESPQMKILGQHFHALPQIDLRHAVHHHVHHPGGDCDW